jgi:hypothetical protein
MDFLTCIVIKFQLKNPVYLSSVDCFKVGCSAGISSPTTAGALLYPAKKEGEILFLNCSGA